MEVEQKQGEVFGPQAKPGLVVTGLAEMSRHALIDERALALSFAVTPRTIRRMVARHELPPPVRMAGRATWLAGKVIEHIEARAERAARKAEQEAQRLAALTIAGGRIS
ncbi:MAG TPA: hypothetical protein VGP72_05440 [Planctomycetota bacterium]|jgi:predicted DNA-binding transcriptional regulator AlpA